MNERQLRERARHHDEIAARYGRKEVPSARVYAVAEEVIAATQQGMETLKPGLYAARVDEDIVHLLKLQAVKGGSYLVQWGVSLAYLPHAWTPRLQWHRTVKSARFDLWENAFEYLGLKESQWRESERFLVGRLNGETYLQEQMLAMWTRLAPVLREWYASTRVLPGVLRAVDKQIRRSGGSRHHVPAPTLVRAFTLARLGELRAAREALAEHLRESDLDPAEPEALTAALESVVPSAVPWQAR